MNFLVAYRRDGAALVIVLAFVVIITGIVVAYLSRTATDRQIAQSNFSGAKADELARSALNIISGDLKQEIAVGSTTTVVSGKTIYNPSVAANISPMRSGVPASPPELVPNLVRRSIRADAIASPGVASRASTINSTTDASLDQRTVSPARWNKHYLIPRVTGASPSDTTPISEFVTPDWVVVTKTGPTVVTAPSSDVLGRYAYAIYDEGGLIDANVAGFPPSPNTTVEQYGAKGILTFADLIVLGMSDSAVTDLVGWRNYATAQPTGSFGSFTFDTTSATRYVDAVLADTTGFLQVSPTVYTGKTDQIFPNRQALITYRSAGKISFSAAAMQYLGTFSRARNVSTLNSSEILRFPLTKLSEVISTGDAATILADFGLHWTTDHWEYWGRGGSGEVSAIASYDAAGPEFFQLLNYALPSRPMSEILTIGASIIDQADTDTTSTIIEYAGATPAPRAYGLDTVPAPSPAPIPPITPVVLNRPLRSAGDLGYAYKSITTGDTLDFTTSTSADAPVLDFFSYVSPELHAGLVNLNTRNIVVMRALLGGAIETQPSTTISTSNRNSAAADIVAATTTDPALSRQDLSRLTSAASTHLGSTQENKEVVSRALGEACQTRTWNLMIDVIAQAGRYPPSSTTLAQFNVEGERRYWLHIAIDRFTGELIDQQLEAVEE